VCRWTWGTAELCGLARPLNKAAEPGEAASTACMQEGSAGVRQGLWGPALGSHCRVAVMRSTNASRRNIRAPALALTTLLQCGDAGRCQSAVSTAASPMGIAEAAAGCAGTSVQRTEAIAWEAGVPAAWHVECIQRIGSGQWARLARWPTLDEVQAWPRGSWNPGLHSECTGEQR
jgi:hypothetical protein